MKIPLYKQKATYAKFEKIQIVDDIREAGFDILIEEENNDVGYFGSAYLIYYVEFDNDVDALAFKLKYL